MAGKCGYCLHYTRRPYNEDICGKTGKLAVYLKTMDCYIENNKDNIDKLIRTEQNQMKEITEKTCSKCGRTLPASEFYKDKTSRDGLFAYCKECSRKAKKVSDAKKAKKGTKAAEAIEDSPEPETRVTRAEIVKDGSQVITPEVEKLKELCAKYEKELFDAKAKIESIGVIVDEQAQLLDKREKAIAELNKDKQDITRASARWAMEGIAAMHECDEERETVNALLDVRRSMAMKMMHKDEALKAAIRDRDYFERSANELMQTLADTKTADEMTSQEMVDELRKRGYEVTCKRTIVEEL